MDTSTQLLICLGAASAANCVPCFEHYFKKAEEARLSPTDIDEAVVLANQMKQGAMMSMRGAIQEIMSKRKSDAAADCDCEKNGVASCC